MSIQILPPQLANQIAAGEVVERPASVVKELVENALDSGADKIEIEIEKGGHKRILVRDNGKGIVQDELKLALARHATSKIQDIDDLEAIASLGFRGEALASISSVSRLTISSRPEHQSQAWSAMAEGLDMEVTEKPCAHPVGTTVEVVDLFFNTPGRRKFLRAEKTEFSHIEVLIKRIALSRPDIGFVLKHNTRVVKRYRSQAEQSDLITQKNARIAEVINHEFVEQASVVQNQYQDIQLTIWAKRPEACVSVNPAQYSFVNGRMMRDKLIQHAIRQAYGHQLQPEQLPEYVIYIELPATQVDVNVHPAKHEVRFHHARLLHDLLVKSIQEALDGFNQQQQIPQPEWIDESVAHKTPEVPVTEPKNDLAPEQDAHLAYQESVTPLKTVTETKSFASSYATPVRFTKPTVNKTEQQLYQKLVSLDEASEQVRPQPQTQTQALTQASNTESNHSLTLLFEQQDYLYLSCNSEVWLTSKQQFLTIDNETTLSAEQLNMAPLLVPVRLKLNELELTWCKEHQMALGNYGFETRLFQSYLIIKQVPAILRSNNANSVVSQVVSDIMQCQNEQDIPAIIAKTKQQQQLQISIEQRLSQLAQVDDVELELAKIATKLNPQTLLDK